MVDVVSTVDDTGPMEKIVTPAIIAAGKVYTAPTHFMAFMVFYEDPEMPQATKSAVLANLNQVEADGFLTDQGRYVGREEAYKIAKAANQLKPEWTDTKLASDFTQSDDPKLDSGWIMPESYARPNPDALISLHESAVGEQRDLRLSIADALRKLL